MRPLFTAFLALFALSALAQEPETALVGEWWEESHRDAFELRADKTATRRVFATGDEVQGAWSLPAAGRLRFAPEDGSEPVTWNIELKDGRFTVPIIGDARVYVRETRADRDGRLAATLKRIHEISRTLRDHSFGSSQDAGLLASLREFEARADGLLLTLAGSDRKKQDAYVAELAKTRPDLKRVLEKGSRGGRLTSCKNNLKMIGVYFALYESKYKKYPTGLEEIWKPDLLQDKSVLRCPATGEENAYEYLWPSKGDASAPDEIMAYDRFPHADGTRCVLLFQGRVIVLDEDGFKQAREAGKTEGVEPVDEKD
ncbi:MAG: hypothetical protein HYY18_05670 [Planctomycetes bacterium]|nr:hypothetical protein [Planctomycetota bacterium]